METKMRNYGEILIVDLCGRLDYQTVDPFRMTILEKYSNKKVIFNLSKLSFVGSSGISCFLDAMRDLTKDNSSQVKFCEVGSEFKRIFAASSIRDIEVYNEEQEAKISLLAHESTSVEDSSARGAVTSMRGGAIIDRVQGGSLPSMDFSVSGDLDGGIPAGKEASDSDSTCD